MAERKGPLSGVRIVEMTGIGPVPYAGMLLADLGADIIRIDRPGGYPAPDPRLDFSAMGAASIFFRSRSVIRLNLKAEAGRDLAHCLISKADALIEGYRPGAMETLGLGPEACHTLNPKLAYVRVTGWGQDGAVARTAGHDLNYIALSGALSLFSSEGFSPKGLPPLIGDMAGGALFAVIGLLSAVLSSRSTGKGQVVDANIVDGTASLYTLLSALSVMGLHGEPFGGNVLDGGRHYYRTYGCSDGGSVAVGAIEPAFRKLLLERLGLSNDPHFKSGAIEDETYCTQTLARIFMSEPRDHWDQLFQNTDGCVNAVLSPAEAAKDPRNLERRVFVEKEGVIQAAPAPRFSSTPATISLSAADASRARPMELVKWGVSRAVVSDLIESGVLEAAPI